MAHTKRFPVERDDLLSPLFPGGVSSEPQFPDQSPIDGERSGDLDHAVEAETHQGSEHGEPGDETGEERDHGEALLDTPAYGWLRHH